MLESSFSSPYFDSEMFPDWNLEDLGTDLLSFERDGNLSFKNYELSSNSSDIGGYNLEDFEYESPLSDAFVSEILGEEFANSIGYSDLDNFYKSKSNLYSNDLNNVYLNVTKKETKCHSRKSSKLWSSMSIEEKEKFLLSMAETACSMGYRNQLDMIHIIAPHLVISSDMKEFTLDISLLDDSKFTKIQEFFKKHSIDFPQHKASRNKSKSQKSKSCKTSKKPNCVSNTTKRQRPKKERVYSETEEFERKKRRKQARQGRKEEKSGLFVYEKIVKCCSLDEDEDVNILE